jgi:hypothetical protein
VTAVRAWVGPRWRFLLEAACLLAIVAIAIVLRAYDLDRFGVRGDEAIYSGQAGTLAGDPERMQFFAVFRAHPLVYQSVLAVLFIFGMAEESARWVVAVSGVAAVVVVWLLARRLSGPAGGLLAAGILAMAPFAVINSRMALLDMPAGLMLAIAVLAYVVYLDTRRWAPLVLAAVALALACLTKEVVGVAVAALLVTQLYRPLRIGLRPLAVAGAAFVAVSAAYPVSLAVGHGIRSAIAYFRWQLAGRGVAPADTYVRFIDQYLGWLAAIVFVVGLLVILYRREPRALFVAWICVVVLLTLQVWKLKEFQLPAIAFPLAATVMAIGVLGFADAIAGLARRAARGRVPRVGRIARGATVAVLAVALLLPMASSTWAYLGSVPDISLSPGRGGYPGQREAALWYRENVPEGAVCLVPTANLGALIQFYSGRSCFGINVSKFERRRNPADVYVDDPAAWIEDSRVHYIITDVVSARSAAPLVQRLEQLVATHGGRLIHEERGVVRYEDSAPFESWLVRIYEVRP